MTRKYIGANKIVFILAMIIFLTIKAYLADRPLSSAPPVSSQKNFTIAIFREKGFPSEGVPELLTPEWLHRCLSAKFSVEYVDMAGITDMKRFNAKKYNLLILPYGEAFAYGTFMRIKDYLSSGGGLMNVAGRPFWSANKKADGKWHVLNIDDPYGEFLSPLGIKYYEFLDKEYKGLCVTTSVDYTPVVPTRGNIFPYRVPARDFYFAKDGDIYLFPEDIEYKADWPPVTFVKHWMNPYIKESENIPQKWALIGAKGENHPLNPEDPLAERRLMDIMEYLSFPVVINSLESELAAYEQGEEVKVFLGITNFGRSQEPCSVEFRFLDEDNAVVYAGEESVVVMPGVNDSLCISWRPKRFEGNFYKIIATLSKNGKVLDKKANGFVIKDDAVLRDGPLLEIKDNIFLIDGAPSYLFGINYYESKSGELMWLRPNILRIKRDFEAMRKLGINFVRVHYHHSKWFRDYFSKVIGEELDSYLDPADSTAMPSERSLRILDAVIQLAQKQGLIFCMDIFSLVPEEMGDPIGWLSLKERIQDPDKIGIQKGFIKLLAQRYGRVKGIAWDLWNEPRLDESDIELLRSWAAAARQVFRENGANHPVTIGDNLSLGLLDVLDYASIHTYYPSDFTYITGLDKPFIFGEIWNDAGYGLEEETRQAEKLEKDFRDFLETEAAGFLPWQWTRQARLWNSKSRDEKWDDELGLCVRDDGSLKPAGKSYASLIRLFKKDKTRPARQGKNT
jgi:hypothetical protein